MAVPRAMNKEGDVISHKDIGPGEWVVITTEMTGGGTGHGKYDIYPDGYEITLRKLREGTKDQIELERLETTPWALHQGRPTCFLGRVGTKQR